MKNEDETTSETVLEEDDLSVVSNEDESVMDDDEENDDEENYDEENDDEDAFGDGEDEEENSFIDNISRQKSHVAFCVMSARGTDTLKDIDENISNYLRLAPDLLLPMKDENDTKIPVYKYWVWRNDQSQVMTLHGNEDVIDFLKKEIPMRAKRIANNAIVPMKELTRELFVRMIEQGTGEKVKNILFYSKVITIEFVSGREETLTIPLLVKLCKVSSIVLEQNNGANPGDNWPFFMAFYL